MEEQRKWVSDIYIDPLLPYQDAKVAAALCVGGPIKYALVEGSGIMESLAGSACGASYIFLLYPHESSCIGMTLVLPLLWACLEPTMQSKVPEDLRQRVQDAYAAIPQLDEGVNPIKKVPIVVYHIEDRLIIDGVASTA